jgi:hypothetical protein
MDKEIAEAIADLTGKTVTYKSSEDKYGDKPVIRHEFELPLELDYLFYIHQGKFYLAMAVPPKEDVIEFNIKFKYDLIDYFRGALTNNPLPNTKIISVPISTANFSVFVDPGDLQFYVHELALVGLTRYPIKSVKLVLFEGKNDTAESFYITIMYKTI